MSGEPSQGAFPPAPDVVTSDVRCARCGYNLRSLSLAGNCPECNLPVRWSLRGCWLRFAPVEWVRKLRDGMRLVLAAIVFAVVMSIAIQVAMMVIAAQGNPADFATSSFAVRTMLAGFAVNLVAFGLGLTGLWLVTAPGPLAPDQQEEGWSARRLVRASLPICALPVVMQVIWTGIVASTGFSTSPPKMFGTPWFWVLAVVGWVVSALACFFVPLALLRHLGGLARRIPRPGLVRFIQIEFWGLLITGALLGLGYFVFFINFLPLLSSATLAPTTGPTSGPSVQINPSTGAQEFSYSVQARSPFAPATLPASGPSASAPTSAPAMPALPPGLKPGRMITMACFVGALACTMLGFAIAGLVLMILLERAFTRVAAEAAINALPPLPSA